MVTEQEFTDAQARVKTLSDRPSNQDLLELYGLYKQGSVGDVTGKRPRLLLVTNRAKYDAWRGKRGLAREAARTQYVALVDRLLG